MIKRKYLIVGHMCWCSPVVGKGTREAEVVGLNPSNAGKNRTRAYSRKKSRDLRLLFPLQIFYFSTQKNDARHLCVDIGDGLRIP